MKVQSAAFLSLTTLLLLAGCNAPEEEPQAPAEPAVIEEQPEDEAVSILRPDITAPIVIEDPEQEKSYTATIGFPDGGRELDADAIAALKEVQASDQFSGTGAIILRTHSDSAGSDAVNARASEMRGLAVAEWLIEAGVNERRIDVVVFGEQNPVEPNALPDGSPNEAGRAANRRVEVEILRVPESAPQNAADAEPEESALEASDEG